MILYLHFQHRWSHDSLRSPTLGRNNNISDHDNNYSTLNTTHREHYSRAIQSEAGLRTAFVDAAAKVVVTMDYGACNVIYIDRRATDDVCDTAENRYEQEHHSNQDEQAQAQEQEQAPKHKPRHLQQRQHNDRDDTPLSTAATTTTTTTTTTMTASATTSMPATATAGAVLDRDTSRRRPAYYQRQPSDVCRNLDAILSTFARGKDEIAQRVTACETLSAHSGKPFFVLSTEQQLLLLRIAFNVCTESDANVIFPYR